jgi:hypothetical protein
VKRLVYFALFFSSSAFAEGTDSGPMVTTDRMTCAQAIKYVEKHGMYWESTQYDGPIPIWWITPYNKGHYCRQREALSMHEVPTLDNPLCLVGYGCHSS